MLLGDHVLFDITPNITDWWDVPDSLGDYLRSLDKLVAYPVTLPLPGHLSLIHIWHHIPSKGNPAEP